MWDPDNDTENGTNHQDEGEDKVVHEAPVFLSKALLGKLYLMQHTLRPATSSFEDTNVLEAKIKPKQDKIQLTFEIDTNNSRYDKDMGERMARQMAGTTMNDHDDLEEVPELDEQILESVSMPEPAKSPRYVVGVIRSGQVHLTPLKAIVQMKPTFPHLVKAETQKKLSNQGAESAGDTEDETEEEATKVMVKFTQSRGGPGGKGSRSYNALKKKQEEEAWVDLTYSQDSHSEYDKLFSGNAESETPFYVLKRENYLESLLPKHKDLDVDTSVDKKKPTLQTKRLNFSQLKLVPLGEQLKSIMLNGGVLHYNHVIDFLKNKLQASFDDTSVLRTIQTVAVLVQGCWVVRSDLVFTADYVSGAHGVTGPVMQRARDTILHQFTQRRWLDRVEMCKLTHLPTEEVTEILSKISMKKDRPGAFPRVQGWEFLQLYDVDFVGKHPEVVQRQSLILEMKISNKTRRTSAADSDLKPPIGSPPPRRRSRTKSYSSDTDSDADNKNKVFLGKRRNSLTNPNATVVPIVQPKLEPK